MVTRSTITLNLAYSKESGHTGARRPDAAEDITKWLAKAKQVQVNLSSRVSYIIGGNDS